MAIVALSTKMYFTPDKTISYCREVSDGLARRVGQTAGVTMVILPDFLTLNSVKAILGPAGVQVGAQDLCAYDRGSFTGEVSGSDLVSLGVSIAEIGHVERRTLYHESEHVIADKVAAAWRNHLTPLLCVGEAHHLDAQRATSVCLEQVRRAVNGVNRRPLWVAYESTWAIGADKPAPIGYVRQVCSQLKQSLSAQFSEFAVVYGGSAGPALLRKLWPDADGLFLGRFAHVPSAFLSIVDEARSLQGLG